MQSLSPLIYFKDRNEYEMKHTHIDSQIQFYLLKYMQTIVSRELVFPSSI